MPTENPSMKISRGNQPHCQTCALNSLCLPLSLNDNDMDKLDEIIRRGRPIQKGAILFQQGEPFQSVYALRTGALKKLQLAYQVSSGSLSHSNSFFSLTSKFRCNS